jgi:uncharacterized protein
VTDVTAQGLPVPPLAVLGDIDPYWADAAEGRLVLPRCRACAFVTWYPRDRCASCGSQDIEWIAATGKGTVYSFSIVRKTTGDFADSVPYVLAYVDLAEGPRVLTNIIASGGSVEELVIGQAVHAYFDASNDGRSILRFRVEGGE